MVQDTPSRALDKFVLRMPDGLRDRIAKAAKANGRSMNAEIVAVLEEYYPAPVAAGDVVERLQVLVEDMRSGQAPADWMQSELQQIAVEISRLGQESRAQLERFRRERAEEQLQDSFKPLDPPSVRHRDRKGLKTE